MSKAVILCLLFAVAFSRTFDFVLHYQGSCSGSPIAKCTGKSASTEVKTHINGNGVVTESHKKLMGSVSTISTAGTYDPVKNVISEVGNITFGVHTTHHLHVLQFTSTGSEVYKSPVVSNSAGWMKITGGKGELTGAMGGASYTCTETPNHTDKFDCWVVGTVHVPRG